MFDGWQEAARRLVADNREHCGWIAEDRMCVYSTVSLFSARANSRLGELWLHDESNPCHDAVVFA